MTVLDFTLQTDTGEFLTLSSLRGKRVVLYFYPKDYTSGCTMESCAFRDLFPRFGASDAVILGVSPDDVASHQKFKVKYNLPFTLLVDENHSLAEQLGIWVEKQMYGQKYMGVQRTTYIIGADGAVEHVFEKVNPAGHAEEVMAFLQGGVDAASAVRAAFDAAAKAQPAVVPSKPATKSAKKPAKKPAKKAAKKAVKKAAKKVVKKTVKKVVKKTVKKAVRKAVKRVAKRPAKKVAKKTPKKPAKKVVKKSVKKTAKKSTKKPAAKK
ncbi:MAG: peroxiredoxin [Gemmatimonadetes bacterium]|nr:peroxiredoxin [Gemmatimonadota bacterium]